MKPIGNYYFGAALITVGLVLVNRTGAAYSEKYRSEYYPQLFGIALIAFGVWTIIKEFIRRQRERKP
jgi:uncharacterized membrane protein YfcA